MTKSNCRPLGRDNNNIIVRALYAFTEACTAGKGCLRTNSRPLSCTPRCYFFLRYLGVGFGLARNETVLFCVCSVE